MSVDFVLTTSEGRPLLRCDCAQRLMEDDLAGNESPIESYSCEICRDQINMANGNAFQFLVWLGLPADEYGLVPCSEVSAMCRRRLWNETRNEDPGTETVKDGRVIMCGRRPGYNQDRARNLLAMCEKAPDQWIRWS